MESRRTRLQGSFVKIRVILLAVSCLLLLLMTITQNITAAEERQAILLDVSGVIGPAISDYLQKGMEKSAEVEAAMVILRMDTPGGLDYSMRQIIKTILASPVPIITYVAPNGARAASAGTYILYASHIAAMAPATNLGAATPIQIGGLPEKPGGKERDGSDVGREKDIPDTKNTLERKMINDATAYIEALADRHGRNREWAAKAVREAVSLGAREALAMGVIDIVADDLSDLLKQVDGRLVSMESGENRLATQGLTILEIKQTWRTKLLRVISNPNVAYILFLVGIYGLIYEFANPGFLLPGIVGAISLLLAMYAFQVLPVNYSGLALILLGSALLISEAFVPSFGSLGIGGIVALVIGSFILVEIEELRIALPNIIGISVLFAAFLLWLMGRLYTMRRKEVGTGGEALIGMTGEVIDDFDQRGRIWLLGESWQAECQGSVKKGDRVVVAGRDGLLLKVVKCREDD